MVKLKLPLELLVVMASSIEVPPTESLVEDGYPLDCVSHRITVELLSGVSPPMTLPFIAGRAGTEGVALSCRKVQPVSTEDARHITIVEIKERSERLRTAVVSRLFRTFDQYCL